MIFPPSGGRACTALSNKLTITCLMSSASTEIIPIDGSKFLSKTTSSFFKLGESKKRESYTSSFGLMHAT